jgi:iron complex outermembrane receptor protein
VALSATSITLNRQIKTKIRNTLPASTIKLIIPDAGLEGKSNMGKAIAAQRSRPIERSLLALTISLCASNLIADDATFGSEDSLWEIDPEQLAQIRVTSLATGTETPLDKAAAVATVITEADILAMGATDLDEILETVPGLHVGRSDQAFFPKYNIRGITSTYNAQTLVLVNGVPITSLVLGNRSNVWAGMPVKSISRIEVIRGPGSAMHGADAFSGVINIVTKTRKDINGTVTGMRAGSFDTQAGWLEHGGRYGEFDIGFTFEYETTDGWREKIDQDTQTSFDQAFMSSASLAPGPVNTMNDMIESRLDVTYKNSRFRAGYQGRTNIGTGPGIAQSLDPNGRYSSDRINADYTYTRKDLTPNWGIEGRISYYQNTQQVEENNWIFPHGAFGGAYPDAFIGNPSYKEENARADFSAIYRGFSGHLVRVGTGGYWGDIYEVTETKNFYPDFSPRPGIENVSDTAEVWLPEKDRTSVYFFAQDEWQLAENWQLTAGVRYDDYSDFGNTTNPRLALVWATTDNITTKLLYGRAFRAPSIAELYITSNPVSLGNPELDPETIDTYEFAFSQTISANLKYTANLFYYQIEDYITFAESGAGTKQAQNIGERTGYGSEVEVDYKPIESLRLLANYAYQKSEDDNTNTDVGDAPNHQVYGRSEWEFIPTWKLNTQVNWVGEQERVAGDVRTALDDYTTVDLTLRKKAVWKTLEIALSVRNLFDEAIYEPSPGPVASIPGDFPMAGRSVYGEVSYTF